MTDSTGFTDKSRLQLKPFVSLKHQCNGKTWLSNLQSTGLFSQEKLWTTTSSDYRSTTLRVVLHSLTSFNKCNWSQSHLPGMNSTPWAKPQNQDLLLLPVWGALDLHDNETWRQDLCEDTTYVKDHTEDKSLFKALMINYTLLLCNNSRNHCV